MQASSLRRGTPIIYEKQLYIVTEFAHRTPGNLRAFVQVTIKNVLNGKLTQARFSATEDIPLADLDGKKVQYLYKDGEGYHFMDLAAYHTFALGDDIVADAKDYLKENLELEIMFHDEKPVQLNLPRQVILKVVDSPPAVRGDSVSNAIKPAVLETGLKISVPLFVTEGTMVKIDTKTGEYLGRE